MSTGQMDNKTYDVIFVARKNAENKNAGMIAENVDKANRHSLRPKILPP